MKKLHRARDFLAGALVTAMIFVLGTSVLAYQKQATLDYTGIQITLNGESVKPVDANGNPVEPFAIEGTTYLPVRAIANALGLGVNWEQATQTVKLTGGGAAPNDTNIPTGSYSRSAPAPVGTAQSIQVEAWTGNYNASVVVLESARGEKAWQMLQKANQFNPAPESGKEYIVAKMRVSINSTEKDAAINLSKYSFTPYSVDNVEYDHAFAIVPEPQFSGNVFAGGTLEGYAVFQVSVSDSAPKVTFGGKYDGSGGIWFSL